MIHKKVSTLNNFFIGYMKFENDLLDMIIAVSGCINQCQVTTDKQKTKDRENIV